MYSDERKPCFKEREKASNFKISQSVISDEFTSFYRFLQSPITICVVLAPFSVHLLPPTPCLLNSHPRFPNGNFGTAYAAGEIIAGQDKIYQRYLIEA